MRAHVSRETRAQQGRHTRQAGARAGAPLLGDGDGELDGVGGFLAQAVCLYTGLLHQGQAPAHRVEEEPHILEHDGGLPPGRRRGVAAVTTWRAPIVAVGGGGFVR